MKKRLSFQERMAEYCRFPGEQQRFMMWMGEKAMDAGLASRSVIRGKCQSLLLFLLSGVVGIAGFLMTQEVGIVFLPLGVLAVCLLLVGVYLFSFVRTQAFEVPYAAPFDRFSVPPEGMRYGYAALQLATFDYCIWLVAAENERTAAAFDRALMLSAASAVLSVVIFAVSACCS